jgi:hypothetical protein
MADTESAMEQLIQKGLRMNKQQYDFGKAPIVMEGGTADPDAFTWECACNDCQAKYAKWKEAFDAQQKQLKENT